MRIWKAAVPGKALPGERARRRAVEGHTKAGVPVAMRIRPLAEPTVTLEHHPRRLGKTSGAGIRPVIHTEMEVIRDQF
jgi:DNA repair photolyase